MRITYYLHHSFSTFFGDISLKRFKICLCDICTPLCAPDKCENKDNFTTDSIHLDTSGIIVVQFGLLFFQNGTQENFEQMETSSSTKSLSPLHTDIPFKVGHQTNPVMATQMTR